MEMRRVLKGRDAPGAPLLLREFMFVCTARKLPTAIRILYGRLCGKAGLCTPGASLRLTSNGCVRRDRLNGADALIKMYPNEKYR